MSTWLTERFGLTVPVALATMAGASGGDLCRAVSRAGGIGGIGVGSAASGEWIVEQAQFAIDEGLPYSVGLMAWAIDRNPAQLDAVVDLAPPLVSLSFEASDGHGGRAAIADHVERLHAAGSLVATQVGSVPHARSVIDQGVDVVIARGREGGGHGFDGVGTLVLLQEVLDAVEVPVLAAGGIAGRRGLAAVLAAGASGAWVGTAFAACQESAFDDAAASMVTDASSADTTYNHTVDRATGVGWPDDIGGRYVRNEFIDTWQGREDDMLNDSQAMARFRAAPDGPDLTTRPVAAGEAAGLVAERRRAADVMAEFAGAAQLLRGAGGAA